MEIIWILIASLGAGIGTGLAGLSAATVMVPILIVLCPSFFTENGVYQATAIALASDILGSAVTAYTYAKHGNIDLKRGWIMFASIVTMCTAGSYAAWLAGDIVLGTFTLFLTLAIGIRFLLKPDTAEKNILNRGKKLDLKGILISLFFGLTIGFGTGFVGTGGGMMMLVVFTMFLGMDHKTAVGTSTLIMTFTALIAAAAHILIHPAIITRRWGVLVVCVITATVSSLFSARFANRVPARTVGLTTGAVLTVLGVSMIFLHYHAQIMAVPLFADMAHCLGVFLAYIVPCVLVFLPVRFLTKIPSFIFRKILHIIAFTCVSVMIAFARSWQAASLLSVLIAVVIWPLLALLEKEPWYPHLFVEKKPGEIKTSLLMLFFMFAAVTAAAWGIFDNKAAAACSILMWGTGDAAAALIGIPFGKHKVTWKGTDGKKSFEGTAADFIVELLAGMLFYGMLIKMPVLKLAGRIACAALAGCLCELWSPSELDTVTVPAVIMTCLLILMR